MLAGGRIEGPRTFGSYAVEGEQFTPPLRALRAPSAEWRTPRNTVPFPQGWRCLPSPSGFLVVKGRLSESGAHASVSREGSSGAIGCQARSITLTPQRKAILPNVDRRPAAYLPSGGQ